MIGLDTNLLLRMFLNDEPAQVSATRRLLAHSGPNSCHICLVSLLELFWTLRRNFKLPKQALIQVVRSLLSRKEFVLQERDTIRRALSAYVDGSMDFPDVLVLELNRNAGATPTYTFDKKAARHPGFELLAI